MMEYTAQVIAILPVPDAPSRWWDDMRPIQARYDTRSLGYDAQVIAILPPIPAAPRCFHDECVPVNAVHSVRSLGYEVRAPA